MKWGVVIGGVVGGLIIPVLAMVISGDFARNNVLAMLTALAFFAALLPVLFRIRSRRIKTLVERGVDVSRLPEFSGKSEVARPIDGPTAMRLALLALAVPLISAVVVGAVAFDVLTALLSGTVLGVSGALVVAGMWVVRRKRGTPDLRRRIR